MKTTAGSYGVENCSAWRPFAAGPHGKRKTEGQRLKTFAWRVSIREGERVAVTTESTKKAKGGEARRRRGTGLDGICG